MIPHSRPTIGLQERKAVNRVLVSGQIAQGSEVIRFEKDVAEFLGFKNAAAVNSGTAAIELALTAMGVKPNHEVLIPSYVCSALWHAVRQTGAVPVLVDVDPDTFNMDMADAMRKRTAKTRALILPHMFGLPCDIAGAMSLGMPILEDCAQSLGAVWNGKRVGGFGTACILSFYATKLITTGEGGMVLSSDSTIIKRVKDLREYDGKEPDILRKNAKMTDLQAALGRIQIKRLEKFIGRRQRIAEAYNQGFGRLNVELPLENKGRVYYRYILKFPAGKKLEAYLGKLHKYGVIAHRPVYRPLHRDVQCNGNFPGAEEAWKRAISIPIYPSLTNAEQNTIIQAVCDTQFDVF